MLRPINREVRQRISPGCVFLRKDENITRYQQARALHSYERALPIKLANFTFIFLLDEIAHVQFKKLDPRQIPSTKNPTIKSCQA
jgi:hypothetical protein